MNRLTIKCDNDIEAVFRNIRNLLDINERSWYLDDDSEKDIKNLISNLRNELDWLESRIEVEEYISIPLNERSW